MMDMMPEDGGGGYDTGYFAVSGPPKPTTHFAWFPTYLKDEAKWTWLRGIYLVGEKRRDLDGNTIIWDDLRRRYQSKAYYAMKNV